MARKTTSVDELYASRHRPYGQNRDAGSRHRVEHGPDMTARDQSRNQMPEDFHDRGYSNDTRGWVRGAKGVPGGNNETAEGKPGFDKGQSYRRADKGNDWGSGHDPAVVRRPEKNRP
jgi:hypothetical protein